ncbi:AMP-dependent synthetase [Mycobacterium hodleri]|uniref:Long-chain-fatty-acid--CoA ligase FadD13 n=1 Tax=Mycolicibacterium hodleri TaxID=49897 RepID=A0A502EH29_9MYCO|nr:AMP-dependent synthetase [Mycolicibacterium hodleri]
MADEPVGAMLRRLAGSVGERPAIVDRTPNGATVSTAYAELYAAADAMAHGLLSIATPGERIGIWAPNSTEWVIVEYAAALAGLVLVPLNPALTDPEVADLLDRSACVVLFTVRDFRGEPLLERAASVISPRVRAVCDLATCQASLQSSPTAAMPVVSPDQPLLVQYTSGTTGTPKAAVLTHRAALNIGVLTGPLLGLCDGPVWCNPMPMHHVGGSVCVLLTVLANAGTMVLMPSFEAGEFLEMLEQTRANVIGAVPTMLLGMLDHPSFADRDLSALKLLQTGGSTVAPALIRRVEEAFGAQIVNAYGQSEAPSAVQTRLTDSDETKALTIGRPGLHREARIVRPGADGTDETVPFGESGELLIRSSLTMTEYLDDPGQTATALDASGWLHTGDLCSMAPDGVLTIRGRIRDVIIRGGENVYPPEVENVLLAHPAISDVAVLGVPDTRWGEQIGAAVRFRAGASPTWDELETFARGSLAGFKVPRIWRAVEEFPTTASGKVQKYRLREAFK